MLLPVYVIYLYVYDGLIKKKKKNEKKVPFYVHCKARLFGTLNRNDIKIRISIFFTVSHRLDRQRKVAGDPAKPKNERCARQDLFFLLLLFLFSSLTHSLVSTPFFFLSFLNRANSTQFRGFPRLKWISSSEPGIKFKWKLDGVPGEKTVRRAVWRAGGI